MSHPCSRLPRRQDSEPTTVHTPIEARSGGLPPWAIGLTGVIVGVVSAAGGTAWLLSARAEESRTALVAAPWLAAHAAGLGLRGTW